MSESKLSFTCVFTTATASAWLHWVWKFCSKTAHKPEKTKTSAPGQLTTLSTSCRCFMVIWCNATIKIVLTAFLNLLNLFFLSKFEQIIPWGNIFFAKKQQLQTTTHRHHLSVAACGQRSPVSPSHDDDVMTPKWLSSISTGTEQEKNIVRMQEKNTNNMEN